MPSAMTAAEGRIARTVGTGAARETLDLARVQFQEGDIDLVQLNIYEQAVTEAELVLVISQADFFMALLTIARLRRDSHPVGIE